MKSIRSRSERETQDFGSKMAKKMKAPQCICLYGNLGSGKTIFSKGFAEGLGISRKSIKSPTFALMKKYKIGKTDLFHCDFYRINEPDDLLDADLEEIFNQKNALVLIEWPEKIQKLLPKKRIDLLFKYIDENSRTIQIKAVE